MMQLFAAYQSLFDHILIYSLLSMSQYITLRAGTFALGTAAFAAIGAYSTAILVTRAGWAVPLAISVGVVLAAITSAVMAFPLSRLRGVFQAVATMALVQVLVTTILNWDSMTHGAMGISGIPPVVTTEWLLLAVAVAVIFLRQVGRYSIGRSMDLIREDETVAVSLGIRVSYHQGIAIVISGVLGGLAGAMYACNSYAIEAKEFGFHMMISALTMAVLGGRKSVWGALVGAIVLTTLPELFRVFAVYRNVVQGSLLVLVMIYLPNGIFDTLFDMAHKRAIKRGIQEDSVAGGATPHL